jgi:DNA-directed RNA polymerase subunit RPC12/RpoP
MYESNCRLDPACGATFEMGKRDYFKTVEDATKPGVMITPAITCTKCRRQAAMRAVKCENCGTVFLWDSVPRDYSDRCPKCGYSEMEKQQQN